MATMTVKGIPDALYRRLKKRAAAHRRSLNSEVLVCLEQTLGAPPVDPEKFLSELEELRARLKLPELTDAEITRAKNWGRK